ncbi:MAG: hypothetical protein ABMA14_04395 [Hyphomonadaceae bacterium]
MKREVDKRKTQKALRKLRRAAEAATAEDGPGLTTWEKDFVEGVTERLETYGSAFRDPGKGRLEEALSARQAQVTRVIEKKSRKTKTDVRSALAKDSSGKPDARETPKPRSSFKQKAKPGWKPRGRDINDDSEPTPDVAPPKRPPLKVIPGGKR